ncbi:hypothetical protein ACHAXR_009304 [Thalassiosira sp. AJA248-18]
MKLNRPILFDTYGECCEVYHPCVGEEPTIVEEEQEEEVVVVVEATTVAATKPTEAVVTKPTEQATTKSTDPVVIKSTEPATKPTEQAIKPTEPATKPTAPAVVVTTPPPEKPTTTTTTTNDPTEEEPATTTTTTTTESSTEPATTTTTTESSTTTEKPIIDDNEEEPTVAATRPAAPITRPPPPTTTKEEEPEQPPTTVNTTTNPTITTTTTDTTPATTTSNPGTSDPKPIVAEPTVKPIIPLLRTKCSFGPPTTPFFQSTGGCNPNEFCALTIGACLTNTADTITRYYGLCAPNAEHKSFNCNNSSSNGDNDNGGRISLDGSNGIVCGCDGITYGHVCEAQEVGMSVAHVGNCVGDGEGGGDVDVVEDGEGGTYTKPPPPPLVNPLPQEPSSPPPGQQEEPPTPIDIIVEVDPAIMPILISKQCIMADTSSCHHDHYFCKGESCTAINGECTPKPTMCAEIYSPVCGCNGKTYGNECEANGMGVSILSDGECPKEPIMTDSSTGTIKPIIVVEEKEDEEAGDCPSGKCRASNGLCLVVAQCLMDPCQHRTCPGDDMICQSNYCGGCSATCVPIDSTAIAIEIEDGGMDEPPVLIEDPLIFPKDPLPPPTREDPEDSTRPVRINDGPTTPITSCTIIAGDTTETSCSNNEYCALDIGVCNRRSAKHPGICQPKGPMMCTMEYAPVCGCNGKTYGNSCGAQGAGVSVSRLGECATPGASKALHEEVVDFMPLMPEEDDEEPQVDILPWFPENDEPQVMPYLPADEPLMGDFIIPYNDEFPQDPSSQVVGGQEAPFQSKIHRMNDGPCTDDTDCEDNLVCSTRGSEFSQGGRCTCNMDTNDGCSPGQVCGPPPGAYCPPGGCLPTCTCDHLMDEPASENNPNGCPLGEVCRQPCAMADAGPMCFASNERRDCDVYGVGNWVCRDGNEDGKIDRLDGASGCVEEGDQPPLLKPRLADDGDMAIIPDDNGIVNDGGGDHNDEPDGFQVIIGDDGMVNYRDEHGDPDDMIPQVEDPTLYILPVDDGFDAIIHDDGMVNYRDDHDDPDHNIPQVEDPASHILPKGGSWVEEVVEPVVPLPDDDTGIPQEVIAPEDISDPMVPHTVIPDLSDPIAPLDATIPSLGGTFPAIDVFPMDITEDECLRTGECRNLMGVCGPKQDCDEDPCSNVRCPDHLVCRSNNCEGCHATCAPVEFATAIEDSVEEPPVLIDDPFIFPAEPDTTTTSTATTTTTEAPEMTTSYTIPSTSSVAPLVEELKEDEECPDDLCRSPSGHCGASVTCEVNPCSMVKCAMNTICEVNSCGGCHATCVSLLTARLSDEDEVPTTTTPETTTTTTSTTSTTTEEPTTTTTTTATTAPEPTTTTTLATEDTAGFHWYPILSPSDGIATCHHDADYPIEYTVSDHAKSEFLFNSQLDCCMAHPNACVGFLWYPHHENTDIIIVESDGSTKCVYGLDYPQDWVDDEEKMFLTEDECCDRWGCGVGTDGVVGDDGDSTSTTAKAEAEAKVISAYSTECTWHIGRDGDDQVCTNTGDYPPVWDNLDEEFKQFYFFPTAEQCCNIAHFHEDCIVVDECVDVEPTAPADMDEGPCNTWHMHLSLPKTCTNSGVYPPGWDHEAAAEHYLYDSSDECCMGKYPDDCTVLDECSLAAMTATGFFPIEPLTDYASADLPWDMGVQWRLDDTVKATEGSSSITNIPLRGYPPGTKADLALRIDVPENSRATLHCVAKIDTHMPFDTFSVLVDGIEKSVYNAAEDGWTEVVRGFVPGEHSIIFRVQNSFIETGFDREDSGGAHGSGHVWLDDCKIISHL